MSNCFHSSFSSCELSESASQDRDPGSTGSARLTLCETQKKCNDGNWKPKSQPRQRSIILIDDTREKGEEVMGAEDWVGSDWTGVGARDATLNCSSLTSQPSSCQSTTRHQSPISVRKVR